MCVCERERERERDGTGVNLSFVGKGRAGGRNGVLIDCTHTPTYLMYVHTYIHALGDLNEITPQGTGGKKKRKKKKKKKLQPAFKNTPPPPPPRNRRRFH